MTATAPRSSPAAAGDGGWQVADLDLAAYLERVGWSGPVRDDVETLHGLHRAHAASIPFENLDIVLGRGIRVDLPAIQAKLVTARRGGYCYEMNLLFAAVLERLGFQVERRLARIGDPVDVPRPRTHLLLLVDVGATRWLVDVGFGASLLEPLPLDAAGPVRQGGWTYRTVRGADGSLRLQERRDGQWETGYTAAEEATFPPDVELANHFTATHPTSPFTKHPIVVTRDETLERRLVGGELTLRSPDGTVETRPVTAEEYPALLRAAGLDLPPDALAAVVPAT